MISKSQPWCLLQRQSLLSMRRVGYPTLRKFHASAPLAVVKHFLLADIGEGIKEVQIIQWFVQPGARVEQFDKLCEVQSDKAATEITSRFDGVIKKLYYEAEDMAQVGKPLCDIDIQGDIAPEDEAVIAPSTEQTERPAESQQHRKADGQPVWIKEEDRVNELSLPKPLSGKHAALATPAVRGLLKELEVDISQITGTGRDGRVTKEDVHKFAAARDSASSSSNRSVSQPQMTKSGSSQTEIVVSLTPIQTQMFKTMTASLQIPHFLYADEINVTALDVLRKRLNAHPSLDEKFSYMPFIIKAVSVTLSEFPLLNARVESSSGSNGTPKLVMRAKHNIGIAVDTPQGLMVPNIKDVFSRSVLSILNESIRLLDSARAGKLSPADVSGGTFTVSNIGSIGGTYVSPIIVSSEVGILGVGKAREVPAFARGADGVERIEKRLVMNFSWCADHRVVDGATMARMGERVRALLEEPGLLLVGS